VVSPTAATTELMAAAFRSRCAFACAASESNVSEVI
jgi:hypothetical protein